MSRIPQSFIDELLARTDVVELIDQRVPLKKTGSNYAACCPFHSEKTPSFTVSQHKQFYHCFGCGANGNAIGFLMNYDHLTFLEAVEILAQQAGLDIPREAISQDTSRQEQAKNLYPVLAAANEYFQQQLRQHSQRSLAINYLKKRGVSGTVAKRFVLGFAPSGWNNLADALSQYNNSQLEEAGLRLTNENKRSYDRFRQRLIFPIRNKQGHVIGFGGRVLTADDEPKYLNSPETPVFHKGQELYGLYEVLQTHRKLEQLIVVEGYMDVLALAQYGIDYAVATLGTATTLEHIRLLQRHCSRVLFCFDGDAAGQKAAWKALETCFPALRSNFSVYFIFLPGNEDPDSFIRQQGVDAFMKEIQQAPSIHDFFFNYLAKDKDLTKVDQKAQFITNTSALIRQIPDTILRDLMWQRLADMTHSTIEQLINYDRPDSRQDNNIRLKSHQKKELRSPSLMQQIISLLIQYPDLACSIQDKYLWQKLEVPGGQLLQDLLSLLSEHPSLTSAGIVERWREKKEEKQLVILLNREIILDKATLEDELHYLMNELKLKSIAQTTQRLRLKMQNQALTAEERLFYAELIANKPIL